MQRRYPGRHGERGGPPDWQERNERATRGAGERGIPDDPARWPEAGDESAYRRFASEDVGPEDWGSEWSERAARPVGQRRARPRRAGSAISAPAGARTRSRLRRARLSRAGP